jgi:hypothetical protein
MGEGSCILVWWLDLELSALTKGSDGGWRRKSGTLGWLSGCAAESIVFELVVT